MLDTEVIFGHSIRQVKQSRAFDEGARFVCSRTTPSRAAGRCGILGQALGIAVRGTEVPQGVTLLGAKVLGRVSTESRGGYVFWSYVEDVSEVRRWH